MTVIIDWMFPFTTNPYTETLPQKMTILEGGAFER